MTIFLAWLVFPILLGVLSLGCGLLVERVAGREVRGELLLPLGFATIAVVTLLTTTNSASARLTAPAVIALTIAGVGLSLPWRRGRLDRWAAGAAVGAFAIFSAPVLLSGQATFAGYIKLDDTASWLGQTDRLLAHGRNLTGLAPSSYEAMLDYYWQQYGYPVGAFPPLGVGHALTGVDSAWLFQPYLSFLAAMLALGIYGLLGRLIPSRPLRGLAAFVAAQPALLYGYALWGGVKEMAVSGLLVLVAALAPAALQSGLRARGLLPLAVACAALFGILNLSSGAWLAPVLLALLAGGIWLRGWRYLRAAVVFAAFTLVLSIPSLLLAGTFRKDVSLNAKGGDPGNLIHPLSLFQVFGLWPVGDFRLRPGNMVATYVMIAAVAAAAVAGLFWAWKRRAWELPLYVGATLLGSAVAVRVGSSWIAAKGIAIASPALLVAATAGVAWLLRSGRRIEAAVITAALVGGVLWSNALAYHDVWLAPRDQLGELEQIGDRFAGQGPSLMTEYQTYGVRHFLRMLDPEGAGELRRRIVSLRNGGQVAKGEWADIDSFGLDAVLVYRTLVLNRSPASSRPPSLYSRVWHGRYYDVWQRPPAPPTRILEHLSLGEGGQAGAIAPCADVRRIAAVAEHVGGVLATVRRTPSSVLQLSQTSHPATWASYSGRPDVVYPAGPGTLAGTISVATPARYEVWLGGSFRRRVEVSIDGRSLGTARQRLGHPGVFWQLGRADLASGAHAVTLRYTAANLAPGSGGYPFALGPLLLARPFTELRVETVQPQNATGLCGARLDWLEAVRR